MVDDFLGIYPLLYPAYENLLRLVIAPVFTTVCHNRHSENLLIIFQSALTLNYSISYYNEVIIMELGLYLPRIIHQDSTLTNIIIRPSCLEACDNYEPSESDDCDSIEADENSVNRRMYDLNCEINGTREWFEVLGSMIARLPNLNQLTFDGVEPNADYLERFWGEVSASNSLTSINFANMNLENSEEILCMVNAPNIRNVMFNNCSLHHEIGYALCQNVDHHSVSTLHFEECRFSNTNTIRGIIEFGGYLALLPTINSLEFTSCALDAELSMCLVRFLREERVTLGLGLVQINMV